MIVGIRAHDLVKGNIDHVLNQAKEYGFDAVQLVFKKALLDESGKNISFNEKTKNEVKEALKRHDVKIAMLGAYFNPVHSNKELVKNNVEYFKEHLKFANELNCKYVGTETGSYNDDKWTYNPKNQTEEGYQDTMKVFHELVKVAKEYNSVILMEPAWGHVIYSVSQLKRAYDEINSEHLKVTIDIYNLIYLGNYKKYKEIFYEALSTFKEDVKIIHLKDFYVEEEKIVQCGLGKGIIDFEYLLKTVKKFAPNATLIFEGVVGDDIITSKKLIDSLNK